MIAIVELSWGAAGFLGLPFIGIVASNSDMPVILYTMAAFIALTAVGFAVMMRKLPHSACGLSASPKFSKIEPEAADEGKPPVSASEGSCGDLFAPEAPLQCFGNQDLEPQGSGDDTVTKETSSGKSAPSTVLRHPLAISICVSVFLAMYGSALTFGNYGAKIYGCFRSWFSCHTCVFRSVYLCPDASAVVDPRAQSFTTGAWFREHSDWRR